MRPSLLSLFIRPHLRVSGMIYTFSSLLLKLLFACTICHRSVIFVSYVSDGVENNGTEPDKKEPDEEKTEKEDSLTAMTYSKLKNLSAFLSKVSASAEPVKGTTIDQLEKRLALLKY